MKLKFFITIVFYLSVVVNAYTQGWEQLYPIDSLPGAGILNQTTDGGYMYVGGGYGDSLFTPMGPTRVLFLVKTDINGATLWVKQFTLPGDGSIYDWKQTTDGGYILGGNFNTHTIVGEPILIKADANGDFLWQKILNVGNVAAKIISVEQTIGGGYILGGQVGINGRDALLMKTNVNGDTLWIKNFGGPERDKFVDVKQTTDSGYIALGDTQVPNGSGGGLETRVLLVKTDALGNTLWTKTFKKGNLLYGHTVKQTADGGYVLLSKCYNSTYNSSTYNSSVYYIKTDANGDTLWTKTHASRGDAMAITTDDGYLCTERFSDNTHSFIKLEKIDGAGHVEWSSHLAGVMGAMSYGTGCLQINNGYAVLGIQNSMYLPTSSSLISNIVLAVTDSLGNVYSNYIKGNIFNDTNFNCQKDQGEPNFSGLLVEAVGNNKTWYGATDSLGNYSILVDTGAYVVNINPTAYWQPCSNGIPVTFSNFYTNDTVDFSLQGQIACPLMEVDISAPFIRGVAAGSNYTVSYCNNGTIDATNVYIDVTIDSDLDVLGTSIPVVSQIGTIYRFYIGNVAYNECGSFTINVLAQMGSVLGQTHCTEAHIYPDSICLPAWNGPIIRPEADCVNDSVRFELKNIGQGLFNSETYYVFEDHVIMLIGNTGTIAPSNSFGLQIAADTGKTYRISVAQKAGFPAYLGDSIASIGIEGCNPYLDGTFNTGFITQFSNGNSAPFIAVDCQPNIGSYDPNDKSTQPVGYDNQHYIYDYTDLDYKIRFQNTGTDTAFLVVIRDTISPLLDLSTLTMGASSHPYTWRLYGAGILEITFANIMLPDSNVNEPASNGFVRYRIEQKAGNALGTVIYNAADIYFDFNVPITTNQTWHTIGDNFMPIILSVEDVVEEEVEVTIYPNPFMETTTIEISGKVYEQLKLAVFDVTGRRVEVNTTTNNNRIQLSRGKLETGIYMYQLEGDNGLINTGKIIVQ